jgi:hypothetical protein
MTPTYGPQPDCKKRFVLSGVLADWQKPVDYAHPLPSVFSDSGGPVPQYGVKGQVLALTTEATVLELLCFVAYCLGILDL